MLLTVAPSPVDEVLAHPVLGQPHVDVPIALTAGACAIAVLALSLVVPGRRAGEAGPERAESSWAGCLSRAQGVMRVLAVVLLLTVITAGRFGADDELENLAPALAVAVAPPLLVLVALVVGPVWRWLDPWDAVARVVGGVGPDDRPRAVWPAVVLAVPLLWYVSAYFDALSPRAVGLVLALYTIVTVGGCIAFGRARWLASAEPIGITLTWIALLPRRRLADWTPPGGAEALLGAVAGGVLFGLVRRAEVWTELTAGPMFAVYSTVGLVVTCAVFAGFLVLMGLVANLVGARPGVARAAVPAVAGIVVAVALARDRLFIAAQLLPGLLGDPFGFGWDLLGPAMDGLDTEPLSPRNLIVLQLAIVVLTHLVAAVVAVVRIPDRIRRLPVSIVLMYLVAASVVVIAIH